MGDVNINVTADTSQATQALNNLHNSMNGVQQNLQATSTQLVSFGTRLGKLGQKMANFGKAGAVAVSVPLLALGIASAKLASDFNESL